MIVRFIGRLPDAPQESPEQGYLALHSNESGDWVPIMDRIDNNAGARPEYASTLDEAIRLCILDLGDQLEGIQNEMSWRLSVARDNLARLLHHPGQRDNVSIGGVTYSATADGTIALLPPHPDPEENSETIFDELKDILIDDQELLSSSELFAMLRDEPLYLAAGMEMHYPELLGALGALMAYVYRRVRDRK